MKNILNLIIFYNISHFETFTQVFKLTFSHICNDQILILCMSTKIETCEMTSIFLFFRLIYAIM